MDPSSSPDIANNTVIKMLTMCYGVLLCSFSLHCMILRCSLIVITVAELLRRTHLPADLTTGSLNKGHFSFRSERGKKCSIISRKPKADTGTTQSSSVFTCSTCRTRQQWSEDRLHLFDFGSGPLFLLPLPSETLLCCQGLCLQVTKAWLESRAQEQPSGSVSGEGATEAPS